MSQEHKMKLTTINQLWQQLPIETACAVVHKPHLAYHKTYVRIARDIFS